MHWVENKWYLNQTNKQEKHLLILIYELYYFVLEGTIKSQSSTLPAFGYLVIFRYQYLTLVSVKVRGLNYFF